MGIVSWTHRLDPVPDGKRVSSPRGEAIANEPSLKAHVRRHHLHLSEARGAGGELCLGDPHRPDPDDGKEHSAEGG